MDGVIGDKATPQQKHLLTLGITRSRMAKQRTHASRMRVRAVEGTAVEHKLVLPSEIPWISIKGRDLEELLYWLFDSMGAKDLEWRIGGKNDGAADQGRDLELSFFMPSPDGTLAKQTWWVDAKGRTNTVPKSEVQEAVLNASGNSHIDVLVVATNTNFSNPTRDWVSEWQRDHPRPIVKLWERTQLENLCVKNPVAVIRLHGRAISPQGRVEVASTKLWDYASFTDEPTLSSIWTARDDIELNGRSLFALVASECANGDVVARSWGMVSNKEALADALGNGLLNFLYLSFRAGEVGARQEPLVRGLSYLLMISVHRMGGKAASSLLTSIWESVEGREYPNKVRQIIIEPVLATLRGELRDVCADDCQRVSVDPQHLTEDEVTRYWKRLIVTDDPDDEAEHKSFLVIEKHSVPCKAGLPLDKERCCPLCHSDDNISDIAEFAQVVDQVVRYRSKEA